jgi:hypothetical protein
MFTSVHRQGEAAAAGGGEVVGRGVGRAVSPTAQCAVIVQEERQETAPGQSAVLHLGEWMQPSAMNASSQPFRLTHELCADRSRQQVLTWTGPAGRQPCLDRRFQGWRVLVLIDQHRCVTALQVAGGIGVGELTFVGIVQMKRRAPQFGHDPVASEALAAGARTDELDDRFLGQAPGLDVLPRLGGCADRPVVHGGRGMQTTGLDDLHVGTSASSSATSRALEPGASGTPSAMSAA